MSNTEIWAISSDQQIPYHDPRAVDLWFKVIKASARSILTCWATLATRTALVDTQTADPPSFLNSIGKKSPEGEIVAQEEFIPFINEREKDTAEFYKQHRTQHKKADIFAALGNHDIRVFDYVDKKLQDIVGQVTPESLWGLDNLGIDYIMYEDLPKERFGGIHVHHGVTISQHSGQSVKGDVESFGVSIMRGHSHRMGDYYKTHELANSTLRGWEIGHMCNVKSPGMMYTNVHNWQQGFAVGLIDGDNVHIELCRIMPDYSVKVLGKIYQG